MSKTEYVIRVLEAIRQRALVQQLGQVECHSDTGTHGELARCVHDCSVCAAGYTPRCPDCGAQV